MFSGIIRGHQKPKEIEKITGGVRLHVPVPPGFKLSEGDSISLDGVCTTVENIKDKIFTVFLMPETLDKSTLGEISEDHFLNLELPLRLNDLVGGHLVSGHVDTTATVSNLVEEPDTRVLSFKISRNSTKYIIYKGSITVNGVSLTVTNVSKEYFSVALIPYTLKNTNLGELKKGSKVNIELDLVAKYLEKLS